MAEKHKLQFILLFSIFWKIKDPVVLIESEARMWTYISTERTFGFLFFLIVDNVESHQRLWETRLLLSQGEERLLFARLDEVMRFLCFHINDSWLYLGRKLFNDNRTFQRFLETQFLSFLRFQIGVTDRKATGTRLFILEKADNVPTPLLANVETLPPKGWRA